MNCARGESPGIRFYVRLARGQLSSLGTDGRLKGWRVRPFLPALLANGIRVFGHHPKDNSPQGIFCANGQCAQCTVLANGVPVKACMTRLCEGMAIESVEGLPDLAAGPIKVRFSDVEETETEVLIIGGGPAGLAAAIELGTEGDSNPDRR